MGKRWQAPMANDKHHKLCNCTVCNAEKPKYQSPAQRRLAEAKRNGLA